MNTGLKKSTSDTFDSDTVRHFLATPKKNRFSRAKFQQKKRIS